jgi:hypothetical protein
VRAHPLRFFLQTAGSRGGVTAEIDYRWALAVCTNMHADTLPPPHCEPFRRMIAHPRVVQALNCMLGPGYNEAFEPLGCNYITGTCGGSIHAGPQLDHRRLSGAASGYGFSNGRAYCSGVNVSWALGDATAVDGGCFVCIPGGHKARWPYPGGPSSTTAIDAPSVKHVPVEAGDVLVFIASGVPHGVVSWRGKHERRCVIQFNKSRTDAVHPGQALGTAMRNHPRADHPDSAGEEDARGWRGQEAPGWDLSEEGFSAMMADLGLATAEDYIEYKARTSVGARTQHHASAKL